MARARHVLDKEARIARDVARKVAGEEARPDVIVLTGRRAEDETDRLALEEIVGRLRAGDTRGCKHGDGGKRRYQRGGE